MDLEKLLSNFAVLQRLFSKPNDSWGQSDWSALEALRLDLMIAHGGRFALGADAVARRAIVCGAVEAIGRKILTGAIDLNTLKLARGDFCTLRREDHSEEVLGHMLDRVKAIEAGTREAREAIEADHPLLNQLRTDRAEPSPTSPTAQSSSAASQKYHTTIHFSDISFGYPGSNSFLGRPRWAMGQVLGALPAPNGPCWHIQSPFYSVAIPILTSRYALVESVESYYNSVPTKQSTASRFSRSCRSSAFLAPEEYQFRQFSACRSCPYARSTAAARGSRN
eukprot:COSAG04_NODE_2330_length_4324_cov_2.131124_2_plen_280_part_00